MPRYDYECTCGYSFEADRPLAHRHDAPPCPRCGRQAVLRVAAPLVRFEGSGWTSPTTQDKIQQRAADHAARGHQLPPKPTYRVRFPSQPR
jgi:putative FmdB family regulatory protein